MLPESEQQYLHFVVASAVASDSSVAAFVPFAVHFAVLQPVPLQSVHLPQPDLRSQ